MKICYLSIVKLVQEIFVSFHHSTGQSGANVPLLFHSVIFLNASLNEDDDSCMKLALISITFWTVFLLAENFSSLLMHCLCVCMGFFFARLFTTAHYSIDLVLRSGHSWSSVFESLHDVHLVLPTFTYSLVPEGFLPFQTCHCSLAQQSGACCPVFSGGSCDGGSFGGG